MFFERIESKGLAHYSYMIGDGIEATVIDPRRDCEIYKKKAREAGFAIKTILETHRNKDYIIGSAELASRTGAEIWHADSQLDYAYGQSVQDGQTWDIGQFKIRAIHTPGHTEGHMSYLLHDSDGSPWMIFTGDTLFAGEVGRVDLLGNRPSPLPLKAKEFQKKANHAIVVDTRMELGFSAAHVPGALSIWLGGLASFAGWFLPYDKPIILVNETENPEAPTEHLIRLGYDRIEGYLAGGMLSWHTAGLESHSIPTFTVQQLCQLLDAQKNPFILDVRSREELEKNGRITDAVQIHITTLPQHTSEIPKDNPVYIFCGSGMRSMIAASLLKREGWTNLRVVLGGLAGWNSMSCPLEI
jgi:rhodanese-related sulfurtransferase